MGPHQKQCKPGNKEVTSLKGTEKKMEARFNTLFFVVYFIIIL
jgi:hypothetical protein